MSDHSILKNMGLLAIGVSCFVWAWSGRSDFQLVQPSEMSKDQFLLDRKTGRVWQKVCDGKIKEFECEGTMIWDEMYVSSWTSPLIYNYALAQRKEDKIEKTVSPK